MDSTVTRRVLVHVAAGLALLGAFRALAGTAVAAWAAARTGSASVDHLVGLGAALMACAALGWIGLLSALTTAALVPGLAGRAVAGAAVRLTPALTTGLTRFVVGLAVASTPVVATLPAAAAGVSVRRVDSDIGPDIAAAALPGVGRPGRAPVDAEPTGPATTLPPVPTGEPTSSPGEVVVATGDCLWTITARALGPDASDAEIATAWPRWYARNRGVVGADPDLLLPGTVLRPPA